MTQRFVTQSELTDFRRCRRKWWLRYIRRRGLKSENRVGNSQLGSLVHEALAAYYTGDYDEEAAGRTLQELSALAEELRPDQTDLIAKQHDLATRIVEGYFEWLAETGADAAFDVLEAEQTVRVDSGDYTFGGKLDLTVRDRATGRVGFLDHKVVGDLTGPPKREPLNTQFLHYQMLQRLLDPDAELQPRGGWKNMLRRVKRTASAKPPFYARLEHWHNDAELRSYWARLHGELAVMAQVEHDLTFVGADHRFVAYPSPTRDCTWDCPYLAVCPLLDSNEAAAEEILARDYVEVDPTSRYNDETEGEGSES